jgi:hypothetical protein
MLPEKLHFSPLSRRLVEASFTGGHITSDAGLLLLREVDRQHGLTRRLAKIVPDRRDPGEPAEFGKNRTLRFSGQS